MCLEMIIKSASFHSAETLPYTFTGRLPFAKEAGHSECKGNMGLPPHSSRSWSLCRAVKQVGGNLPADPAGQLSVPARCAAAGRAAPGLLAGLPAADRDSVLSAGAAGERRSGRREAVTMGTSLRRTRGTAKGPYS